MTFEPDLIPEALRSTPRWVRWSLLSRAGSKKPTKVPRHPVLDSAASSTDPATWGTFDDALSHVGQHGTCGAGFVLTEQDPFVGVDFDHVLDEDGRLNPVAATIIEDLHSYSEISPSGHGVRVIVRGRIPVDVKHKADLGNGAVLEFWDRKRFVTMTGNLLPGSTEEVNDATEALCRIIDRYELAPQRGREGAGGAVPPACAVPLEHRIARARQYVQRVPGAVEGEFGSTATFMLAQRVVRGFALPEPEAVQILEPWNRTCRPPWPAADLARKVSEAATKGRMPWACMVGGPLHEPAPAPVLHAVPDDAAGHEPSWLDSLIWVQLAGGARKMKPCVSNAALFLSASPAWAGHVRSDTFGGFTCYTPGGPIEAPPGRWSDQHTLETWRWLETQAGLFVSLDVTYSAVKLAAARDPFHPLQDWLDSLVWDGIERLDTWLEDLAGVPRTPYGMAVARKFLLSAVARAMRPGAKADHALLLEGAQGIGKSTLLEALFAPWFTDEISVLGSKDASMQLRGVWCVEIGELDSMHRSEISSVKAFISRTVDRYRPAYGREIIEVPRTAVFTGSTNSHAYLKDDTGARRFWPVACSAIDLPAARASREQLWAEALVAFRAGETWWLDLEEHVQAAISEQELRFDEDPWTEPITNAISAWSPMVPMTSAAVMAKIGVEVPKQSKADQMRVASILRRMGYEWKRARKDGEILRVWSRREP